MSDHEDLRLSGLPEARFGLSFVGFLALTVACQRLEVGTPTGLAVLAVGVVVAGGLLPLRYALPTGLMAWGCVTGFLVNDGGQLTFAWRDLTHLGLLAAIAVAASALVSLANALPSTSRLFHHPAVPPATRF